MPKTYVRAGLAVVDIAKALEGALEILVPKSKDEDGIVRYKEPGVDDAVLAKQLNEQLGTKLGRGHVATVRIGRFGQLPKAPPTIDIKARDKLTEAIAKLAERIDAIEGILLAPADPNYKMPDSMSVEDRTLINDSLHGFQHLLDAHSDMINKLEKKVVALTSDSNTAVLHRALGEVRATQGEIMAKLNHDHDRIEQLASKFVEMGGDELSNLGANETPIQRMRRLSKEKETGFKISNRGKHER